MVFAFVLERDIKPIVCEEYLTLIPYSMSVPFGPFWSDTMFRSDKVWY